MRILASKTDPALWPHEYVEVIWQLERDRLDEAAKARAQREFNDLQREFFADLARVHE